MINPGPKQPTYLESPQIIQDFSFLIDSTEQNTDSFFRDEVESMFVSSPRSLPFDLQSFPAKRLFLLGLNQILSSFYIHLYVVYILSESVVSYKSPIRYDSLNFDLGSKAGVDFIGIANFMVRHFNGIHIRIEQLYFREDGVIVVKGDKVKGALSLVELIQASMNDEHVPKDGRGVAFNAESPVQFTPYSSVYICDQNLFVILLIPSINKPSYPESQVSTGLSGMITQKNRVIILCGFKLFPYRFLQIKQWKVRSALPTKKIEFAEDENS